MQGRGVGRNGTTENGAVRRLPLDPGASGWNAILPPPAPASILQGNLNADWLVIGLGFAGLAAARELSLHRPQDRIVLVDAVRVGEGPAGRNSGFMIDLPHDIAADGYAGSEQRDAEQTAMNRAAIAFAKDAVSEFGLADEAFALSGKINAAATENGLAHNSEYARHLAAMGESHRLLDAAEMRTLTGTDYYLGGLYTPGTAMIQPAMYVRGLARGLAQSTEVYENSPVTGLNRDSGFWYATMPKGTVRAPRVILAVNGHAESFGFFTRRLMHVFTYASMTRALTPAEIERLGGAPRWGVTPSDPMGTTVRRISGTGGDRVIIRSRFTYDPEMTVSPARLEAVRRVHIRGFEGRFSAIADVTMEHTWGGRLCLAWNGVPAFGEVAPGLFAACCQNGVGAAKGTLSGFLAARLALKQDDPMVAAMLKQEPPRRLPPEPLTWIGANATMRWKEWRAGKEV